MDVTASSGSCPIRYIRTQFSRLRIIGHWHGVPSLGPATLGILENQVSSFARRHSFTPHETLARMCYAYQQLNDIGIF